MWTRLRCSANIRFNSCRFFSTDCGIAVNSTSAQQLHFAFTGMSAWHSTISRYGVSISGMLLAKRWRPPSAHCATGRVCGQPARDAQTQNSEPSGSLFLSRGASSTPASYRLSGSRAMARIGLRMMPTFPSSPPKIPYGGFSRFKCSGAHFTGYVISPFMWPWASKSRVFNKHSQSSTT